MKTKGLLGKILLLSILAFTLGVSEGYAVEFIMKKNDGTYIYRCGPKVFQGEIRVIPLNNGRYRIMGKMFIGEAKAQSPAQAARKGCGETE